MRKLLLVLAACGDHHPASNDAPLDGEHETFDATTCERTAPAGDHAHHVVVSHPYDAGGGQANDWEVLELSAGGAFSRPGHHFTMGRADVGEVTFTPDGTVGIAVQDDGSLGVFTLDAAGTPAVTAAKLMGGFYAGRVVMAPTGDRAYVLDDEFRNVGGGIYRIDIACDGTVTPAGLVMPAQLAAAFAYAYDGNVVLAAANAGDADTNGVHLVQWDADPNVIASANAFGDDMAIVGGATLTRDAGFFLVGDTSQFANVPNRVAVVPLQQINFGTPYTIANVMDPLALVASPFTDDVLVASGFGNALYDLHMDNDGVWRDKGPIAYTGAAPQLPGGAVRIDSGALAGTVLVGENLGVRRVELGAAGIVDHGLYSLGSGTANVVGAVGVTP
jgi:hypothetical protein